MVSAANYKLWQHFFRMFDAHYSTRTLKENIGKETYEGEWGKLGNVEPFRKVEKLEDQKKF